MTNTDHAIVTPAVTGDPGTRDDAGGFDPGRPPFRTRDGREVRNLVEKRYERGVGWEGEIGEEVILQTWWPNGRVRFDAQDHPRDLVNADPDPIPQPEGDAPPAPAQSAGAAADGENDVVLINHALSALAEGDLGVGKCVLKRLKTQIARRAARPHEPADASARSARAGAAADGEDNDAFALRWFTEGLNLHEFNDQAQARLRRIGVLARRGARPHEPADASARSARGEVAEAGQGEGEPVGDGQGFVFYNPDTGWEYNLSHPINSGECHDATDIRKSTHMEDCLAAQIIVPPSAAAAPASRATSAPARDVGPAGVTDEMVEAALAAPLSYGQTVADWVGVRALNQHGLQRSVMRAALEAAARARTPDAGKETGR